MAFLNNKSSKLDQALKAHFDYNNALKESISSIISNLKKIGELEEVEKREIFGLLSKFSGTEYYKFDRNNDNVTQMKTIFDKIEQDAPSILEMLNQMLNLITNENKEIYDFLNSGTVEIGIRDKLIGNLKVEFHSNKQRLWEELRLKLGQEESYVEQEYTRAEETEEEIAKKYVGMYIGLEEIVMHDDGKNEMRWDAIYKSLKDIVELLARIGKYKDTILSLAGDEENTKIPGQKQQKKNSIKFAKSYFNKPTTFNDYFTVYNENYKEYRIYSKFSDEEKKGIDKLLSDSLGLLFKNVRKIKDKLKEDSEKSEDLEQEVKNYYISRKVLYENIIKENLFIQLFKTGAKFLDFEFIHPDLGKITIEKFEKDYVENKSQKNRKRYIDHATGILNILASKPKEFVNSQHGNNIGNLLASIINSENDDSSDKKISSDDKEKIEDIYHAISSAAQSNFNMEDDLKEIIKKNMSDLLTLLFGGNPSSNIKNEDGTYKCNRFIQVCNSYNRKSHSPQIQDTLSFAYNRSKNLEGLELDSWKEFIEKISFLF